MCTGPVLQPSRALPLIALLCALSSQARAINFEQLPESFPLLPGSSPFGPPPLASFEPSQAPQRDPSLWPRGYYPGDPLPPKTIYLTFDDGPWAFTGQIVEILHEEGARATFFMNAYDKDAPFRTDPKINLLLRYADVLRRMVADGNVIGNHTYSHQDLARLSNSQIEFQLGTLQRQLHEVLGDQMPPIRLLRPPFGSPWLGNWNTAVQRRRVTAAIAPRALVMLWTTGWDSSDSADWAAGEWFDATSVRYHPGGMKYVDKMTRELMRILRHADGVSGGIILMHDTHPTSRDILKPLIEELKRRGYHFETLEDYCRWRWGPGVFDELRSTNASGIPPTAAVAPTSPVAVPTAPAALPAARLTLPQ